MCGTLGSSALARKPKRSHFSIVNPAASIAAPPAMAGVAAAGDGGPDAAPVGDLEDQPHWLAAGDHMLVEAELTVGSHDPPDLGQSPGLVRDAAEDQARHGRVYVAVGERQGVGGAGLDDYRHGSGGGLPR
jgi:hypothetical protein